MTIAKKKWLQVKGATTVADGVTATVIDLPDPGLGKIILFRAYCLTYDEPDSKFGYQVFGGGYHGGGISAAFLTSGTASPQTLLEMLQGSFTNIVWTVAVDGTTGNLQVKCNNTVGTTISVVAHLNYTLIND